MDKYEQKVYDLSYQYFKEGITYNNTIIKSPSMAESLAKDYAKLKVEHYNKRRELDQPDYLSKLERLVEITVNKGM